MARTYTKVRTSDGAWQLIPNGMFAADVITKDDREPGLHRAVRLSVPVDTDLNRVFVLLTRRRATFQVLSMGVSRR